MGRKFVWTALALTGLLCFTGCGNSAATGTPSAESSSTVPVSSAADEAAQQMTTYLSTDRSFQVQIPMGWKTDSAQSESNRTVYLSPNGDTSLELTRQTKDPNLLSYSAAEITATYQKTLQNFLLQAYESVTINGTPGIFLRYTCTKEGVSYTVLQTVYAGASDYSLTYSTIAPTEDFLALAQTSFQSFQVLKPEASPLLGRLQNQIYTAGDNSYTITLPSGWKIQSADPAALLCTNADGSANLTLTRQAEDSRLFRYQASYYESILKSRFGESTTLTTYTTRSRSNGSPAVYVECTTPQGESTLLTKQLLFSEQNATYLLTLTATAAASSGIDFDAIANSISISSGSTGG